MQVPAEHVRQHFVTLMEDDVSCEYLKDLVKGKVSQPDWNTPLDTWPYNDQLKFYNAVHAAKKALKRGAYNNAKRKIPHTHVLKPISVSAFEYKQKLIKSKFEAYGIPLAPNQWENEHWQQVCSIFASVETSYHRTKKPRMEVSDTYLKRTAPEKKYEQFRFTLLQASGMPPARQISAEIRMGSDLKESSTVSCTNGFAVWNEAFRVRMTAVTEVHISIYRHDSVKRQIGHVVVQISEFKDDKPVSVVVLPDQQEAQHVGLLKLCGTFGAEDRLQLCPTAPCVIKIWLMDIRSSIQDLSGLHCTLSYGIHVTAIKLPGYAEIDCEVPTNSDWVSDVYVKLWRRDTLLGSFGISRPNHTWHTILATNGTAIGQVEARMQLVYPPVTVERIHICETQCKSDSWTFEAIYPSKGSIDGGILALSGKNLKWEELIVIFGPHKLQPFYGSPHLIVVEYPPDEPGKPVEISLRDQLGTERGTFLFHYQIPQDLSANDSVECSMEPCCCAADCDCHNRVPSDEEFALLFADDFLSLIT